MCCRGEDYEGCENCLDAIETCTKDVAFVLEEIRSGRSRWTIELANAIRELALKTETLIRVNSKTERRT